MGKPFDKIGLKQVEERWYSVTMRSLVQMEAPLRKEGGRSLVGQ
jgi:hypothetical protein